MSVCSDKRELRLWFLRCLLGSKSRTWTTYFNSSDWWKMFSRPVDTGADVSIISSQHWPTTWPTWKAMTDLQGIGMAQGPLQTSQMLTWSDKEGHTGTFQPFILDHLPVNLWGQDILTQMSVLLYSPSPQVAQMMLNQRHVPSTGLESEGQGRSHPISPQPLGMGLA